MALKNLLDEAFAKGRNIREGLLGEILGSKLLGEVANSALFAKLITTVFKTKEDLTNVVKNKVEKVFEVMDVPTRSELSHIERKLDHLEKLIDKVGKRAITIKSIKKIQHEKNARK